MSDGELKLVFERLVYMRGRRDEMCSGWLDSVLRVVCTTVHKTRNIWPIFVFGHTICLVRLKIKDGGTL